MPVYEYRCNHCKKWVALTYKTYADFDRATPTCTHCGSTALTRMITRVAIAKSEGTRFADVESDDSALDDLANADPQTIGRFMRKMGGESGEDLGEEFNEVVDRLESGQSPEDIEQMMAPPDDGGTGLGSLSGFDGGLDA